MSLRPQTGGSLAGYRIERLLGRGGMGAVYLARVHDSATRLVAERHMLAEDVDAVIERAGRLWDFIARA